MKEKTCAKCHLTLPLSDYGKNCSRSDGLQYYCRKCKRLDSKEWKLLHKEQVRSSSSNYYKNNRDEILKRNRRNYEKTKSERSKVIKRWKQLNPDKVQAGYENRRKNLVGKITGEEWREIKNKYGNVCLRCGTSKRLSIDHVIPISKGGTNTVDNIQPLCGKCNSTKGTKIIDYRRVNNEQFL